MSLRSLRRSLAVTALLAAVGAMAPAQAKDFTVGLSVATLAKPFIQAMSKGVID